MEGQNLGVGGGRRDAVGARGEPARLNGRRGVVEWFVALGSAWLIVPTRERGLAAARRIGTPVHHSRVGAIGGGLVLATPLWGGVGIKT